jgi:hypothetical protein
MKKSWPGSKANEAEVEIQAEARETIERSSRSRSLKLTKSIVTMIREKVLNKDNMEEEVLFLEIKEEEEPEEAWLNAIHVEKKDINLGNVLTERAKVEKQIFLKHRSMCKKKQHKEEETT